MMTTFIRPNIFKGAHLLHCQIIYKLKFQIRMQVKPVREKRKIIETNITNEQTCEWNILCHLKIQIVSALCISL
jgi:hypothetical protein